MNQKTFKVIKGYSELDYTERKEVREFIQKFEGASLEERKPIVRGLSESVGPLDQGHCPCCGK